MGQNLNGLELKYIKEEKNIVANAISCLDMNTATKPVQCDIYFTSVYAKDKDELPEDAFPLTFKDIGIAQLKDGFVRKKNRPKLRNKDFSWRQKTVYHHNM